MYKPPDHWWWICRPRGCCWNLLVQDLRPRCKNPSANIKTHKLTSSQLLFNLYQSFTDTAQYTVPGPTLWSGAGGVAATSAPASVATSAVGSSSASASSAPAVTSAQASPTTAGVSTTASITTPAAVKTSAPASAAPATTSKPKACKKKRHARNFAVKN